MFLMLVLGIDAAWFFILLKELNEIMFFNSTFFIVSRVNNIL